MFDPARKREAYLPRTNPLGKSERLYSRRSSLPLDRLTFFIQLSFRPCCTPGAEDTNSISLFRVGDHYLNVSILRLSTLEIRHYGSKARIASTR